MRTGRKRREMDVREEKRKGAGAKRAEDRCGKEGMGKETRKNVRREARKMRGNKGR